MESDGPTTTALVDDCEEPGTYSIGCKPGCGTNYLFSYKCVGTTAFSAYTVGLTIFSLFVATGGAGTRRCRQDESRRR